MNEIKQKVMGNIIVASIVSIAIIISCFIGVRGLAEFKSKKYSISVKGYATEKIISDRIVWTGFYEVQATDLVEGYKKIDSDKIIVLDYFLNKGFKEEDLIFSSISISENRKLNEYGMSTDEIIDYKMAQTITINSDQIDKVTEISRNSTELLSEGVTFQSYAPEYHYTKLDDLKVNMLAEATQDATKRAKLIGENAGSKLGELTNAKISSIKVTPQYSIPNEYYYEYGYGGYVSNDVASLEKEVTVTVNCTFEVGK